VRFGIEGRVSEQENRIRTTRSVYETIAQLRNQDRYDRSIKKKNEALIKDKKYIFDIQQDQDGNEEL